MIDDIEGALLSAPDKKPDTWHWGTVTQLSPLRVRLDGDTAALDVTPDSLVRVSHLSVGARVRVHVHGGRAVVQGVSGGSPTVLLATQTFTANGTYTPTPGMLYARVRMVGGGGAGGQAAATGTGQRSASTGGSGGAYGEALVTAAQVGASQAVTIGAAGSQGNGGTTSLGSLCSASGGLVGGNRGPSSGNWAGNTNAPAGATATAGTYLAVAGGRGGGSKGITGVWGEGGNGGSTPLGQGGVGHSATGGDPGSGYGSGGGGVALSQNESAAWGGNGAPGVLIIEEYGVAS